MENNTHKGTELNNVSETWDQNERQRAHENSLGKEGDRLDDAVAETDLEQLIKQEASEYDHVNKENRILTGERATLNDDAQANEGD